MGPKQVNFCKPEQVGTKDFGKMLKNNSNSRGRKRVPAKETKNWRIEGGEKKRITRKEYQRLLNKFEMEGLVAEKMACGTWQRTKS